MNDGGVREELWPRVLDWISKVMCCIFVSFCCYFISLMTLDLSSYSTSFKELFYVYHDYNFAIAS